MPASVIIGLSVFAFFTLGLGTMIMGIRASAGGTGKMQDIPWKKYLEHSYGYGIAAIPGAAFGLGAYLFTRTLLPFIP